MYLFYDLETSGLNPIHDAVLQAAFIQADADLGVQRELTLRCRLPAHVVPSPDAMLVTGLTPTMLEEQRLGHLEMMAQIGRIITDAKPCMILGYNILRYDEEVLRQNFFQGAVIDRDMRGFSGEDRLAGGKRKKRDRGDTLRRCHLKQ